VVSFRVWSFFLATGRRPLQASNQFCFGNTFDIGATSQGGALKARAVKRCNPVEISVKPGFHGLDHQMQLVVPGRLWSLPFITYPPRYVVPRVLNLHGAFAIHKEKADAIGLSPAQGGAKRLERIVATATGDDAGHPAG